MQEIPIAKSAMRMPKIALPKSNDRQIPVPFVHNHMRIDLEADTPINHWADAVPAEQKVRTVHGRNEAQ
jgi:hypothetical protein